ncbi:hypothetical protein C1646_803251 [Rhizophagus diaphanus]|nr:hypothetical protein C1646_803251 [Rhizophagus diaphanus] [Rhizophagus sp. MUCL 43196]
MDGTSIGPKCYNHQLVQYEFCVKCAGYVHCVKNAIINVFGKAFIGNCPGHKAYENLWCNINKDGDNPNDTYINCITNEVLKEDERTFDNYLFVIAIIDLMFDLNVQTTTLSSDEITRHMAKKFNEQEEMTELDNNENNVEDNNVKDNNAEDGNVEDDSTSN